MAGIGRPPKRNTKLAIKLSPGYATAHLWYAWHLILMGRNSEGLFELTKAESLDPLSLIISADLADALCIAHLFDEAVQQSKKTLQMDPNFAIAHYELGQAFEQKHITMKQSPSFRKRSRLPDTMAPSTQIAPTSTPSWEGR